MFRKLRFGLDTKLQIVQLKQMRITITVVTSHYSDKNHDMDNTDISGVQGTRIFRVISLGDMYRQSIFALYFWLLY